MAGQEIRGRGRPPGSAKLTPALIERVASCLRTGMTLADAAGVVNVSDRTLRRWRTAGETAETGTLERELFMATLMAQASMSAVLTTATVERGRMRA